MLFSFQAKLRGTDYYTRQAGAKTAWQTIIPDDLCHHEFSLFGVRNSPREEKTGIILNFAACGGAGDSDTLTLVQDNKPKTPFRGRRQAKFLQGVNHAGVVPRGQGIEGLVVLNGA